MALKFMRGKEQRVRSECVTQRAVHAVLLHVLLHSVTCHLKVRASVSWRLLNGLSTR